MDKSLIKKINARQTTIDALNAQISALQETLKKEESLLEGDKATLLKGMQEDKVVEVEEDNLFANVFEKKNVGYTSEAEVIKKLKELGLTNLFKVTIKEALDKNPLKKELKTNKVLEDALKPLIVENTTTYVVVTTQENHTKMFEHIENKSNKPNKKEVVL